jgi:lysophospholipase L1-like esterase
MVSASGVGLMAGFREFTAETLFKRASYYRNNTAYTPTRTPDIVVINLGTNDETKGADSDAFQKEATEFLQMLRTTYGENVKIVLVHGMMKSGLAAQWNRAMSALGGEDAGFYLYKGTKNTAAGNGHPNLATQKSVGEGLASFLGKTLVEPIA